MKIQTLLILGILNYSLGAFASLPQCIEKPIETKVYTYSHSLTNPSSFTRTETVLTKFRGCTIERIEQELTKQAAIRDTAWAFMAALQTALNSGQWQSSDSPAWQLVMDHVVTPKNPGIHKIYPYKLFAFESGGTPEIAGGRKMTSGEKKKASHVKAQFGKDYRFAAEKILKLQYSKCVLELGKKAAKCVKMKNAIILDWNRDQQEAEKQEQVL